MWLYIDGELVNLSKIARIYSETDPPEEKYPAIYWAHLVDTRDNGTSFRMASKVDQQNLIAEIAEGLAAGLRFLEPMAATYQED